VFEVRIQTHFSAAHHLRGYPGACSAVHGHNWEVEVAVQGRRLNETGILVDFRQLKDALREALVGIDHADLNELAVFKEQNPTSENIARFLYGKLSADLNSASYRVAAVTVRETPGSMASYWEDAER